MTIRSRLNLSLAAAISIMLVFSGLIVRELGRVTSVVRDNLKVNALTKQIILLHSLTHDYLDAPSTRAEVQWQANYATLKKLLQEMQRDPDGITRIPPHVVENYDNIQENFAQITAVARREGWVDSGQSVRIGALESQFFAQLLTKNQELYDWMLTASAASNNRLLSAMRRDSLLFVGLLLV